MRPIIPLLLLLFAPSVFAQAPESTVATLPPASTTSRQNYRVTDSLTLGDCTQGGGTKRTICTSNGSIWISVTSVPDKIDVGLANVDNVSDANKPVSVATQTALNLAVKGNELLYEKLDAMKSDATDKRHALRAEMREASVAAYDRTEKLGEQLRAEIARLEGRLPKG